MFGGLPTASICTVCRKENAPATGARLRVTSCHAYQRRTLFRSRVRWAIAEVMQRWKAACRTRMLDSLSNHKSAQGDLGRTRSHNQCRRPIAIAAECVARPLRVFFAELVNSGTV